MEEKVFFDGELGKVCGVLHSIGNKDEIVILVHGFSSTKETSAKPNAELLNTLGLNALRIDLDNQGESELDFKTGVCIPNYVKQVEASINFVKERGFKEISLLGTSFGGLVVLSTALTHPEIKRLFLRAPVFDWQKHAKKKLGDDFSKYKKERRFPHFDNNGEVEYYFSFDCYETAKDYSMFEHAHKIKQPIMIIQGDMDESVDPEEAKKIVNLFPNAELKMIKGAGHILGVDGDFSEGENILEDFFKQRI